MMKALALFAAVAAICTGCATLRMEEAGVLTIECNVPEAAVLLDDNLVGRAAELRHNAKSLRPGFYRVELRHPGYYAHFAEVNIPEGGAATVKAELHPLLD